MSIAKVFALMAVFANALMIPVAQAASLTFVVRVPPGTPASSSVWLSGDRAELGDWNGAGLRLLPAAGSTWTGTIALPTGTIIEYKITQGNWDTVEKSPGGVEMANRRATFSGGDDTLYIEVAAWRDQTEARVARAHTITGTVAHHDAFASKFVAPRDVLVWLPPGYAVGAKERYPVVYFHDGQNVFDAATSFIGAEWAADEAADRLIRAKRIPPVIMVAISNTDARRDEYTSDKDARQGGGGSAAYFRFMVEELQPFVNRTYRTRTGPAHTTVIGSSLGGLAALDLGLAYPERFGLIGCVSPAVWWADTAIAKRVRSGTKPPLRVWVDIGTAESTPSAAGQRVWLDHARLLRDALEACGWREGTDLHYEEVEGAPHNEGAWAARIDRILEFLLAKQ